MNFIQSGIIFCRSKYSIYLLSFSESAKHLDLSKMRYPHPWWIVLNLSVRVLRETPGDEKTLHLSFLQLRSHIVIMNHQVLGRIAQMMDIFQSLFEYFPKNICGYFNKVVAKNDCRLPLSIFVLELDIRLRPGFTGSSNRSDSLDPGDKITLKCILLFKLTRCHGIYIYLSIYVFIIQWDVKNSETIDR